MFHALLCRFLSHSNFYFGLAVVICFLTTSSSSQVDIFAVLPPLPTSSMSTTSTTSSFLHHATVGSIPSSSRHSSLRQPCSNSNCRVRATSSRLTAAAAASSSPTNLPPPPYPVRIIVLGGGNFGLASATVVARNGVPTTVLLRNPDDA